MSLLTKKLKRLRGITTVEELAKSSGASITSVYKAEQDGGVRWETIKRIYGPLFAGDDDRLETMVLWAMDLTKERFAQPLALDMARAVVMEETAAVAGNSGELASLLAAMLPDDRELLLAFARKFAASEPTRLMAKAWIRVVEETHGRCAETEDGKTQDARPQDSREEEEQSTH